MPGTEKIRIKRKIKQFLKQAAQQNRESSKEEIKLRKPKNVFSILDGQGNTKLL